MFRTYLKRLSPQSKVSLNLQAFLVKVVLHGTIRNDDFLRNMGARTFFFAIFACEFLIQLQNTKHTHTKKFAQVVSCNTPKNRRCESSRVTSPEGLLANSTS